MINRRQLLMAGLAGTTMATMGWPGRVLSQEGDVLRLGVATEWFSLDPHFHSFPANLSLAHHVYDALTVTDANDVLHPSLAESWEAEEGGNWVFHLRRDARFSNGEPLTAADVVATFERVPVAEAASPLTTFMRGVTGAEAIDDHTVRILASRPDPLLPKFLSAIHVIAEENKDRPASEFDSLDAAIGSGPYRFVRWDRGERLLLEPNPHYWGPAPEWANVEYRVITDPPARVAALLSGGVNFIQSPSTESMERLRENPSISLFQADSPRITYLQFHQGPEPLEDMTGTNGQNPFTDPRVRKAVSLAIPRENIRDRLMEGLSTPATQIVAPGRDGFNPDIPLDPLDLERAAELMAEAGWADGFGVRLTTPNDRNINGVRIAQAVASSLQRINIRVDVNAIPLTVQQAEWREGKHSFFLHGNGPQIEAYLSLVNLVHTMDRDRALGTSNESFYSNPELDEVIQASLAEVDDDARLALMRQAAQIVYDTTALVPLHHEVIVHATRNPLSMVARGDERIYAVDFE